LLISSKSHRFAALRATYRTASDGTPQSIRRMECALSTRKTT
jgi:hypothetical protein